MLTINVKKCHNFSNHLITLINISGGEKFNKVYIPDLK